MSVIDFRYPCACVFSLLLWVETVLAQDWDPSISGDSALAQPLEHPEWFALSFLDLGEDLENSLTSGKRGIILYFGQNDCPYCKAQLDNNWGREDIVAYTRKYFDVIHIDVRGARTVTDFENVMSSEKDYAHRNKINFTPTMVFVDQDGRIALNLAGYRPPYQFRAALEYVADGHYRNEDFRKYLSRAEPAISYGQEELNENDIFSSPPYVLDRRHFQSKQPTVVFFEEGKCHPCDVLHGGPMATETVLRKLQEFEVLQLDMWSDTGVLTPAGDKLTAKQWADKLGISYAPTLLFIDKAGKEILRVDSVVGFYRLNGVLDYVLTDAYKKFPSYLQWRDSQSKTTH